jgi:hypothetical protein
LFAKNCKIEILYIRYVKLKAIKIKIISFLSNDQPGFVECIFFDSYKNEHRVQEKIPVVTDKELDEYSEYPQDGFIACEVTKTWIDKDKRKIYSITTEKPWGIETIKGLNKFDLHKEQLIDVEQE